MDYLINMEEMRTFACNRPIERSARPEPDKMFMDRQPCYVPPAYDCCLVEDCQDIDGNVYREVHDTTHILLHAEKYRKILGPDLLNELAASMHPKASDARQSLTEQQMFDSIISRHVQSLSDRRAVLEELAERYADLKAYAQEMLNAEKQEPDAATAPATE